MIFITGCEGFVGLELARQCRASGLRFLGVDIGYDVRDRKLIEIMIPEGAVVVHLAAVSTDKLCEADPLEALDVNVAGTINVAKAALKRKCKQFIFSSTEKVYGDLGKTPNETYPPMPNSVYTWGKAMAEQVMRLSGIPNVTVLRFGLAYGCRDTNWCAVEQIASDVVNGKPPVVGHPDTARKYVHVRDLCAGILAAVGRTGHETFNLPGSELVTLRGVWQAALKVVNSPVASTLLSRGGGSPSVRNTDGTKAREVLGWVPKNPFSEGMKEVVEYLRGKHG